MTSSRQKTRSTEFAFAKMVVLRTNSTCLMPRTELTKSKHVWKATLMQPECGGIVNGKLTHVAISAYISRGAGGVFAAVSFQATQHNRLAVQFRQLIQLLIQQELFFLPCDGDPLFRFGRWHVVRQWSSFSMSGLCRSQCHTVRHSV